MSKGFFSFLLIMLLCEVLYGQETNKINAQNNGEMNFRLDSLPLGSTIKISADFASCGEFGNHNESIIILMMEDGINSWLVRGAKCDTREPRTGKEEFRLRIGPITIAEKELELINEYLEEFKAYRIDGSKGYYNAHNTFKVILPEAKIYYIDDWTMRWDEFTPLKNKLFNLSDKNYKGKL